LTVIGTPRSGRREVAHRHSVETLVKRLDSGDELVGQLKRRNLLLPQGFRELAGAAVGPFRRGMRRRRFGHDHGPCFKVSQKDGSTSFIRHSQKSPPFANLAPARPARCFEVYGHCAHAL
jgi:hypothetical protein